MRLALVLYNGLTLLDFIGFYDPITRVKSMGFYPDLNWVSCGITPVVADSWQTRLQVDEIKPDLKDFDALFIPGGFGTRTLMHSAEFMDWLSSAATVPLKMSVCTGSLLLGAAGFLRENRATTHFDEYETLRPFCREVVAEELVDDGHVITAGAVASSLELGLYLCQKLAGPDAAKGIARRMNYVFFSEQ